MYVVEFPFNKIATLHLQPTTGRKPPLQILSWECSERNRYSKISIISKKPLQNGLFSQTLHSGSSELLA